MEYLDSTLEGVAAQQCLVFLLSWYCSITWNIGVVKTRMLFFDRFYLCIFASMLDISGSTSDKKSLR
jgi:hypothetical protein